MLSSTISWSAEHYQQSNTPELSSSQNTDGITKGWPYHSTCLQAEAAKELLFHLLHHNFQRDKGADDTDILSTECTWFSHSLVLHNTDRNSQHQHCWVLVHTWHGSFQSPSHGSHCASWLRVEPHPSTPSNTSTAVVPFLRIHIMQLREWAQAFLKNSFQACSQLLHRMLHTFYL